jgi:hypothetical protein
MRSTTITPTSPLRYAIRDVDGHHLLARDPDGGRRVVEAIGDVALADHVAVLVPGNGHHLGNYFTETGPVAPRARGQLLLDTMRAIDPDVRSAVVVWVGYHAPDGLAAAASNRPARDGAADLARLTHHLPRAAHLTVVGHSYGSTVAGLALADSRADDLVALGSPGLGVWRGDELGTQARLWAAQAESDWIRFFPRVRLGGLGLGRSPLHPALGGTRFDTGDVTGHCGYYAPGSESLRNIARIALGRYDDVTPAGTTSVPTDLRGRRSTAATPQGVAA